MPWCAWEPVESRAQAYEWGRKLARALFKPTTARRQPPARAASSGTESLYQRLKRENRVEDLAARLTELRVRGKYQVGLCPFHAERTPSFTVNTERQTWKCWGCQRHGDAIDLLRELGEL